MIVRGLTEEFDEEVLRLYGNEIRTYYLGQRWEANFDVRAFDRWISGEIAQQHSDIDWRDLASALIVTNKNPHRKDTGQVFYVVPLGKLHHEREIHEIVTVILDCIKSDDFGLLEAELTKRYGKEVANGLKLASQFFELKPNVAGIGLNLNAVIDAYLNKQK